MIEKGEAKVKIIGIIFVCFLIAGIPATTTAKTFDISIEDGGFNPTNLVINKGDTVRWTNNGTSLHTATSGKVVGTYRTIGMPNGIFNSGELNPGVSFEHTFTSSGEIDYFDGSGEPVTRTGLIAVSGGGGVKISPASSMLHPFQSFDLVIFLSADPSSRISIIFDGDVVFDGDWFQLLTVTDSSFNILLATGFSTAIHVQPPMLSSGVHTVSVKVITPTGQEFSDTAVYTVVKRAQGLLPLSNLQKE